MNPEDVVDDVTLSIRDIPSTLEVLQSLVGKKLVEVKPTTNGILLVFTGGVVLWWQR